MSKSPEGPWHTPAVDTFDGRAFYAAKSASDGDNRYVFGWNPNKEEDLFGFNPENYKGKDYNTWGWGGSLIVHQLIQNEDGTLSVKIPESVNNIFKKNIPLSFEEGQGELEIDGNSLKTRSEYGFSSAISKDDLPGLCEISGKVSFKENTRSCGIMLRVQDDLVHGYYFRLEPDRNRVTFNSHLMQSEDGGKTFPYELELERPIQLESDREYAFNIIIDDTICEFYLNDEIVMGTRMYDLESGKLGLFVSEGRAEFSEVTVKKVE